MKAITLWQPWATLIGEKLMETRGRRINYRGALAIHAALKIDYEACEVPEIKAALAELGYTDPNMLPVGSIVSTCTVFDCVEMKEYVDGSTIVPGYKLSKKERAFGDYRPGRYAYILANVKRLKEPIPAKGKQGIWNWEGMVS